MSLRLSSPTGGATLGTPDTAVLTIRDNDVAGLVAFTAAASTVRESAGLAHVKVTRSGTAAGVTVDIETADGSATASLDYLAVPRTTLAFAAGERSKTIAVEILEDAAREGHETVRLLLSNPTGGAALGPHGEALLTITDNDPGATVQFGAAGYTVAENAAGGVASLTITRTGSAVPGQGALLSTAGGGTAVAGTDFAEWSGAVAFAGGGAKATVAIPIVIDNAAITGHRTVNLQLSNPTGGLSLGVPRTAVLTILEDDASVQFSEPGHAVAEGGVATLTVTRTGGSHGPATVSYATGSGPAPGAATASADYTAGSGSVVFPPGATSRTIQVRTARDVLVEGAETFQVQLSGPTPAASVSLGSPSTATVTIADDDAPGVLHLASAAAAVNEGKTVTLTVMRSGGSTGPVTVSYATTDGGGGAGPATGGGQADAARDYTATAGTLSFPHGVRSRTVKLPTKADTASEGPETFTVSLSSPGGGATLGAPDATVVTIVDDETPRIQLARADHVVAESSGSFALTVRRIGPTRMPSTVDYALAGLTATGAGVDFAGGGGVLTFAPGVTSRTIVVPIVEDTTSEGPETFTVSLASPTGAILGAPAVGTVTITDDDLAGAVQFGHRSYAVLEGGTATISVTRTGTAGPVTVDYATASATAAAPADYEATSGTLTFHVGETVQTFTVPTASDAQAEGSELVTLTLSDPTDGLVLGSPSAVTLWILDPIP